MKDGVAKKDIVGSWNLVSAKTTFASGRKSSVVDQGVLTYTQDGRVTAMIGIKGRPTLNVPMLDIKDKDAWIRRPLKMMGALVRFINGSSKVLAYCGSYRIDGKQIRHTIEMSSIKDLESNELVREARIEGGNLILVARNDQGRESITELVWSKS